MMDQITWYYLFTIAYFTIPKYWFCDWHDCHLLRFPIQSLETRGKCLQKFPCEDSYISSTILGATASSHLCRVPWMPCYHKMTTFCFCCTYMPIFLLWGLSRTLHVPPFQSVQVTHIELVATVGAKGNSCSPETQEVPAWSEN